MLGAIMGDFIGSRFENQNAIQRLAFKSKDFELVHQDCKLTDDSMQTMAVAKAVFECRNDLSNIHQKAFECMKEFGRKVKYANYSPKFFRWIWSDSTEPLNSFGNGAAMCISPVAYVAKNLEECKHLAREVCSAARNHPEGLKGAECISACIFLAWEHKSKEEIRSFVQKNYYDLNFTLDQIRPDFHFEMTCQYTVPPAIEAFLESTSFEDCIRNAVSIGGDSDTVAAMAGSIAEAFYGLNANFHVFPVEPIVRADMICYVEALEYLYNGYNKELTPMAKKILGL